MERTSFVKRNASSIGSRLSSAVSDGSANHETIGIALSENKNQTQCLLNNSVNLVK